MKPFEELLRAGGSQAVAFTSAFFSGNDPVHVSLRTIAAKLAHMGLSYAVYDDLAMAIHGLEQTCDHIELIMSPDVSSIAIKRLCERDYGLIRGKQNAIRDLATGVRINILVAGEFPGDHRPKPITIPDPIAASITVNGINFIKLRNFIELKLITGITSPLRIKDIADIQELIKSIRIPRILGNELHEFARIKFLELWDGWQNESGSGEPITSPH